MTRTKPTIFISHIHEDGQIANCLKRFLDRAFLGLFTIFVSSDGASIRAGDNWSAKLEQALTDASIVLAIITEESRDRRWIHFECGGAYYAGKRVIPVCCRGFSLSRLTEPLSWLHAIDGSDSESIDRLLEGVAGTFDLHKPISDIEQLRSYLAGQPCDLPQTTPTVTRNAQRAFPLFLVVDTSGSMAGPPVERMTAAIKRLLDDLMQASSGVVVPFVSIISFGSEAREVMPLAALNPDNLHFTLEAYGVTALGSALHLLANRLDDDSQMPAAYLRPMVILFTDGEPTDDWRLGLEALNASKLGKQSRRVAVGIGDSYNASVLNAIAGDSVLTMSNTENLQALSVFFSWMSSSVRDISTRLDDELIIDLPPIPPDIAPNEA